MEVLFDVHLINFKYVLKDFYLTTPDEYKNSTIYTWLMTSTTETTWPKMLHGLYYTVDSCSNDWSELASATRDTTGRRTNWPQVCVEAACLRFYASDVCLHDLQEVCYTCCIPIPILLYFVKKTLLETHLLYYSTQLYQQSNYSLKNRPKLTHWDETWFSCGPLWHSSHQINCTEHNILYILEFLVNTYDLSFSVQRDLLNSNKCQWLGKVIKFLC